MKTTTYLKRIKTGDLVQYYAIVKKEIRKGNFEKSFELLDKYGIGPQTLSPRKRNFLYILVEQIHELNQDMRFSDYLTVSEGLKACEFFKLFFARGVDVNHQDKRGLALLQWVALLGAEDLVQFLLEQGADPNLVDDMSRTALEETIDSFDRRHPTPDPFKRGGCLAIIPALLRAGADPFRPYPNVDEIATNKRFQWNLDMRTNCQRYENAYDLVYKRAQEAYEHGFISSLEEYDKYRIFTETLKEMGKL